MLQAICYPVGTTILVVLGPGNVGGIVQADAANTADIYLGGPSLTADNTATGGFRLAAGQAIPVELGGDDALFAISTATGQLLRVVQGMRQ